MPRGRPKKEHDNSFAHGRLKDFRDWYEADGEYCGLDDILSGACRLDLGGNTRPLSMDALFHLLKSLPAISTESVRRVHSEFIGRQCSLSHAKKLCITLRIASREFERLVHRTETRLPAVPHPAMVNMRPLLAVCARMPR
jgi:hypothetical protein